MKENINWREWTRWLLRGFLEVAVGLGSARKKDPEIPIEG